MDLARDLVEELAREFGLGDEKKAGLRELLYSLNWPLLEAAKQMDITDEERVLRIVASLLGIPYLRSHEYPEKPVLLDGVSIDFLRHHAILPLQGENSDVVLIINEPWDLTTTSLLEKHFSGSRVSVAVGHGDEIRTAIDRIYGAMGGITGEAEESVDVPVGVDVYEDDLDRLRGLAQEAPVVRLVNVLLTRALDMRASDIHFEPTEKAFKVRCRVDGVLYELDSPPKSMQPAIISRLKLMANMDIAERRLPQDGRIKLRFGHRDVDIRVSTAPTIYGESVVLRLLSQEAVEYNLEKLGMDSQQLKIVTELIERPYGMILVTGPTGSGKTTTLYAILRRLNTATKKIITVEDPVEYQIDGINQIQVKPQINLTFANALRSLVRQDPDVLLIGEIRDHETADIAVESALTGHLVFSTLHTNDAPGAITRLRDLGIESFLIADSVLAVMAQRLVRVLCEECREPYEATDEDMNLLQRWTPHLDERPVIFRHRGCRKCGFTGYRGRQGIFELFIVRDRVRSGIVAGKDAGELARLASDLGYRPLISQGCQKVLQGITTISEVLRVTSLT
ncbi:GspE/PulE family protein [Thermodesulforhabdus norvegica]|uniref:Type II secretion system protein E (GspE) n=1 Tax=Thermodesulforhabdus norvegica TaxID=39841 RepID=A0A1I4SRH0_9BACT|nr:ATPase, T2SS/T4P/T4SS family [Thermodesulforhabdus norvegica]SFM67032.1 type II secretion system protein E (GspE) [Thermodesulforhabdus norvegica]